MQCHRAAKGVPVDYQVSEVLVKCWKKKGDKHVHWVLLEVRIEITSRVHCCLYHHQLQHHCQQWCHHWQLIIRQIQVQVLCLDGCGQLHDQGCCGVLHHCYQ